MKELNRRDFLKVAGLSLAGVALSACNSNKPTETPSPIATRTATATATGIATSKVTETAIATKTAEMPKPVETVKTGKWEIELYKGATDQMKQWAKDLKDVATDWKEFPNVDNSKYNFKAANGVEYGMAESAFCQRGSTCDINVPAGHYRLITGDYVIPGVDDPRLFKTLTNESGNPVGEAIALFNVGEVTAMYRESSVDYGFTVEGRYWNGDAMPETMRALMSNTAFNMMRKDSDPLPLRQVNPGANCSVKDGCKSVLLTVAVVSGNELLMKATTTASK